MSMPIKYRSVSICLVDKYSSLILLNELKYHGLSARDVQPTPLYSRRGWISPYVGAQANQTLYIIFWLWREIHYNIEINFDHSKQWVCLSVHFLCELGWLLCIYVYLEYVRKRQDLEMHRLLFSFMWVSSEQYPEKSYILRWLLCWQRELRLQSFDSRW